MKNLLFILSFMLCLGATAQSANNTNSVSGGFRLGIKNPNGHQFLINDWHEGNLVKNDGGVTDKMLINYDLVDNAVVLMKTENGETKFIKLDNSEYTGFVITDSKNQVHIYSKIDGNKFNKAKKENKFYSLINAPEKSIILETVKTFKDPNRSGWNSTTNTNKRGEYKTKTEVYVLTNNGKYTKVKLSNKGVEKALKDKKNQISTFLKQKNISIKKVGDLIPVIRYYKTLK